MSTAGGRVRRPLGLLVLCASLLLACGDDEPPAGVAATSRASPAVATATATQPTTAEATQVAATTSPGSTAVATAQATATQPLPPAASEPPTPLATESATPATTPPRSPGPIELREAFGGRPFDRPIEVGAYPGGLVFVADQDGLVLLLDEAGDVQSALLDLRETVRRNGNEEGLLSIALDPAFVTNGYLYAYYSASNPRRSVLSRFTVEFQLADRESELVILEQEQPRSNHNGGAIRFGLDGMLYLGFGDGGGQGDPRGNGQDPSSLLGTIIRIDVRKASLGRSYTIPPDNPAIAGARPEVYAYGLRNPWRMAFDPATGALWVGDVGQGAFEEVDIVQAGGNYGWNVLEGDACFEPRQGCDRSGKQPPVIAYSRSGSNCSITGGVVARDPAQPGIFGFYLYADLCSGRIWAMPADGAGEATKVRSSSGQMIVSFGTAGDAVYLLAFGEPVWRIVDGQ